MTATRGTRNAGASVFRRGLRIVTSRTVAPTAAAWRAAPVPLAYHRSHPAGQLLAHTHNDVLALFFFPASSA